MGGIVLSSREKPLEELPNLAARARAKVPFKPKTPSRTPRNVQRGKEKEGKKEDEVKPVDITEYISSSGEILYPKLLKDEVLRCDANLIVAAKKATAIGGTTLILAILDEGQLWVANVGDSRAVFGNSCGVTVPMSYDHKPCQLKEKKRIQEAGGFVAMNGVGECREFSPPAGHLGITRSRTRKYWWRILTCSASVSSITKCSLT